MDARWRDHGGAEKCLWNVFQSSERQGRLETVGLDVRGNLKGFLKKWCQRVSPGFKVRFMGRVRMDTVVNLTVSKAKGISLRCLG